MSDEQRIVERDEWILWADHPMTRKWWALLNARMAEHQERILGSVIDEEFYKSTRMTGMVLELKEQHSLLSSLISPKG